MTYDFIESLYRNKQELFLPYTDDGWIEDWLHFWTDDFDEAFQGDNFSEKRESNHSLFEEKDLIGKPPSRKEARFHRWLEETGRVVKYWPNTPNLVVPDAWGFHLPFHVSRDYHGIYLIEEGCQQAAKIIAALDNGMFAGLYQQIAKIFTYYHEAFHHKVEMFATRLELIVREKCFLGPVTSIYQEGRGTVDWQEEVLANIHAYFKTVEYVTKSVKGKKAKNQLCDLLVGFIRMMPTGYKEAAGHIIKANYNEDNLKELKYKFWERIQQRYLPHTKGFSSDIWQFAMFDYPYNKINGRFNFLVQKDSDILHRLNLNGRFLSTREFVKKLKKYGKVELKRAGKGSHQIWIGPSGSTLAIPSHKELKIGTIGSILKTAGLNMSVHEFLRD